MPLVFQIIGIEICLQHRDQYAPCLIVPADFPYHQHHLRRKIYSLSKQIQRHGHQFHIITVVQTVNLTSLQLRQCSLFLRRDVFVKEIFPSCTGIYKCPGQLRPANQHLRSLSLLSTGQPCTYVHTECFPVKAYCNLFQQFFHKFCSLLFRLILHPQHKFVSVQPESHCLSLRFIGKRTAAVLNQVPDFLENHISKHNSVFLIGLLQLIQNQFYNNSGRPDTAAPLQLLHPCTESIKAGDTVSCIFPQLPFFFLLLFLDITDTSHQLAPIPLRVINCLRGKQHPLELSVHGPF